jgi:hypothetical protein
MPKRRSQSERAHYIALLNEVEYAFKLAVATVERKLHRLRAELVPPEDLQEETKPPSP